ncbi:MAG: ABC transporter permease subunit [Acidimicrobiales bacterium]
MEPLTSVNRPRSGPILHLVLAAILIAGPEMLARFASGITSFVTWPITRELRIEDNRFEIFNAELLLVYLIAVLGLNLLMQSGLISIGHSAFFALGAYTVAIATVKGDWPLWPALLLAMVLSALLGLVLGLPSLRLGLFTLAMVTVGYAFVTEDMILEWREFTGGGDGLRGVPQPSEFDGLESFYWVIVVVFVAAYALAHNWLRSPLGRAGRAIEENEIAARSMGINPYSVKLRAFIVSGAYAGVAGGLFAPLLGFVAPEAFTVNLAILLLLMTLFGGAGTLGGPIIGGLLLFRIPLEVERVTDQPGEWSLLVYGLVLVLSVHLVPQGLMSAWWLLRRRLPWLRHEASATERTQPDLSTVVDRVPDGEVIARADDLRVQLGGVMALDGVTMEIRAGTVHALIGPNGSGKTTFLNAMSGYLVPTSGAVELFDQDAGSDAAHVRARSGLARTFQTPFVLEGASCLDNVMTALDMRRKASLLAYVSRMPWARREERERYQRALAILEAVGIGHRLDTAAGDLPPGERRLLELARVVALGPRLVLMDEPAAGLSTSEIAELGDIIRALRSAGIAVVLVEHHVDVVLALADEITVLDFGSAIAHGTPDEIRTNPHVIAAYLGSPEPHTPVPEGSLDAQTPATPAAHAPDGAES